MSRPSSDRSTHRSSDRSSDKSSHSLQATLGRGRSAGRGGRDAADRKAGTFDYLVVGGGTSGAVVARRLAEDPGVTVALLEAGPSDEGIDKVMSLRRWQELLGDPDYGCDFRIEPQLRGNGDILHCRGVMLGGCSSHNSCIAFQPPASDFEKWTELGALGWGPDDVEPYFQRVRSCVSLERTDSGNEVVQAFIAAGREHGFRERDFTCDVDEGVGWFLLNKRGDQRCSSSVAYLHPLAGLPGNLTVRTNVQVARILLENGRAVGVDTAGGAIRAEREVIVCAGAFGSPTLLQRSGVGPAELLRGAGVPVVVDLPSVGEHLQDHPEGVVVFEANRPVPETTHNYYEAGLFARVDEDAAWPDLMFHFGSEAFDMHTAPRGYPTADHAFSLTPNVTRAKSEGFVRLRSADPGDPPIIDFRYFTDPQGYDERLMVEGVRLARELAREPSLAAWTKRELAPGTEVTSFDAISEFVRTTANTVYHPGCSCRMGADHDAQAVVAPDLRVRGVEGLRVADASVFPIMVSTNPALTCMMIGEKAAALIHDN
ncbi:MAG: GMC oxidoreductase [Trueperaceae bacterium]